MRKTLNWVELCFSLIIVLLPFLYQFKGIGQIISFGELLLLMFSIPLFLKYINLRAIKVDGALLWFYIVTVLSTIVCSAFLYFEIPAALTVFARLIFFAVVVCIARQCFYFESVYRLYNGLCFIFSAYLIVQYFYHYVHGGYLPIYLDYNWQFPPEARPASLASYYQWAFRASSLFLEPSHFSLYVLPSVALTLFQKNKTLKSNLCLVITCIALILSTASSGILGLLIIFTAYLLNQSNGGVKQEKNKRIGIVLIALAGIGVYFAFSSGAIYFADRLLSGGSINQRIVRGVLIYNELPLLHKIIGVGINNIEPYMLYNNMKKIYDEVNLNYCCSVIQTLNFSGIIGFFALLWWLYCVRKRLKRVEKKTMEKSGFQYGLLTALFWLLTCIMSYESILFSYRFCFLICIIYGVSNMIKQKLLEGENYG